MAEASGGYADYAERPEDICSAPLRARKNGMVGFVNVETDYRARATKRASAGRPLVR